ncbi:peptide chain release factor N(5)-glutamine methyltransferase [Zhaonella formicivorans]|uniref:peptide chain release factor N(5)-glutamine methyltransferase n=1 Tax=Zhaonella formicivorans TaxID=2528593 RepID=UPI0010E7B16A|nr:peptide chain release factor N(5)-glutamine methyltransferase [Zhaonella formicivorans]
MLKSSGPPTAKKELAWAVPFLHRSGILNARLEAEVLLAHALGWTRAKLLGHLPETIGEAEQRRFREMVKKRAEHYPLQYLTGCREFMSLDFAVNEHVLIPRDDTEILVQAVLGLKRRVPLAAKIVDVGTGSGIIAICLKKFWPEAQVFAVDISEKALKVAKRNAEKHSVEITFVHGDLLQPFLPQRTACTTNNQQPTTNNYNNSQQLTTNNYHEAGGFDIVVSNPPYIPAGNVPHLQPEVTFEPVTALAGGEDGLAFYRRLARESKNVLDRGGWLALEIGSDQGADVKKILASQGFSEIEILDDYANLERVIIGRLLS